jgi:GNAT superfamily N-acetyltransferase
MPLDIRPFSAKDQDAARQLILAGLEEHWGVLDPTKNPDLDDITASYAHGLFLAGWLDGELCATGALIPEGEGTGRIVRMSVARQRRRQGIGRQMLARLVEAARLAGYRRVVLETTAAWQDAVGFYQGLGFESLGEWNEDRHFAMDV